MPQANNMIDSVHNLQHAGMSRRQAEALTRLMCDSIAEAVQHLATKAELAELRQYMETHMATKAELAELRAYVDEQLLVIRAELAELRARVDELGTQVSEVKAGLLELKTSHDALAARTDAQMALLRGELTKEIGTSMRYVVFSVCFSTVAIIVALFATRLAG